MNAIAKLNELAQKLSTRTTKVVELAKRDEEDKGWPKNRIGLPAGSIAATGALAYGAHRYGADAYDAYKRGGTMGNAMGVVKRKLGDDVSAISRGIAPHYKKAKSGMKGVIATARKAFKYEAAIAKKIIELDAMIDQIHASRKARKSSK